MAYLLLPFVLKSFIMGRDHRGHPSGVNKSDDGTAIPSGRKFIEDPKRDEELTNRYTDEDRDVSGDIHQNNSNRNADKGDATNAGGYKN